MKQPYLDGGERGRWQRRWGKVCPRTVKLSNLLCSIGLKLLIRGTVTGITFTFITTSGSTVRVDSHSFTDLSANNFRLDVGEGKEVNLVDKCPRSKLQEQCIKYLGPVERKAFEVTPEGGKLFYKETGEPLHTLEEPGDVKWIFVLSTSKTMYIGIKKKGSFQHSSFLAGGAALAAGRLVVERGTLKAVWPHSGHYRPTAENFRDFVTFLQENGVDLTDVKLSPVEEESSSDGSSVFLRSNSSAEDLTASDSEESAVENTPEDGGDADERKTASPQKGSPKQISRIQSLGEKLANLEVPTRSDFLGWFESCDHETADKAIEEPSQESSSLQVVGKQPCSEWTTGAGPRIKYVRGYPPELQVQALEQVSLSPRSSCLSRSLQSGTWHSPVKLLTESSSSELVKRE
ncbi:hypothetical protein SAY86_001963 [Trapa natans]|uniref:Uncharacterized protein n=1 Tax=Trapa natans TaxID=22666 RepID=A0AAN7LIE6_TRANT|nr:hypothetical protein SAY86_001963 [Trapa natans]